MGSAKQLGWFVGIWAASVGVVGLVSFVLHYWLT